MGLVAFDWEIDYALLSPDECPVEALGSGLAVGMTGLAADIVAELDFRNLLAGSGAQWNSAG